MLGCKDSGQPKSTDVKILTWTNYLTDSMINRFKKQSGLNLKIDYFSTNEELLSRLETIQKTGDKGYDLILPSDYLVKTLIEKKLIQPIDKKKLTYLKDFEVNFQSPDYDKALKYVIPFAWGTTGVAIHYKKLGKEPLHSISWKDIFENPKFKGKVSLLDDVKEVVQAALLVQGKNFTSATAADFEAAFAYISKNGQQMKTWALEPKVALENSECVICHIYSGDALSVIAAEPKGSDIQYLIPSEGASIWTDNFAIPTNAQNIEGAYAFLNSVQSAESAAEFTKETQFPTPNLAAKEFLPKDLATHPMIYPPSSFYGKLHYLADRPEIEAKIEKFWTSFRAE